MIEYNEEIKKMNLWEKISQISSEIEYLKKDDKVGFGNNAYKAISIEKVMTSVSEKMNKFGIVIYPVEQVYDRKDEEVTKKDGTKGINRISDVDVKYQVVNIHSPQEQFIVVSSGTGVDTQDKGIGKAMTYAYKNMIIKLFAIATGDDTDKVHSDEYTNKLLGNEIKKEDNNISEKQIKRLYAIGNKAGITPKQIIAGAKRDYNIIQLEKLTKAEYDELCEKLEKAGGNK